VGSNLLANFHEYNHQSFMEEALKEAEEAGKRGDRPIGTVIVHNGTIISRGSNRISTMDSELAHAEINALNQCAESMCFLLTKTCSGMCSLYHG
jgi:tRNA(adenine34) deaminase